MGRSVVIWLLFFIQALVVKTQLSPNDVEQIKFYFVSATNESVTVQFSFTEELIKNYTLSIICDPSCNAVKEHSLTSVTLKKYTKQHTLKVHDGKGNFLLFLVNTDQSEQSSQSHQSPRYVIYGDAVKFLPNKNETNVSYCAYLYRSKGSSSFAKCPNPGDTSLLVDGLTSEDNYTVCTSLGGQSTSGNYTCMSTTIKTTSSTMEPVTNMTVVDIRATSAVVQWLRPAGSHRNEEAYVVKVRNTKWPECSTAYLLYESPWREDNQKLIDSRLKTLCTEWKRVTKYQHLGMQYMMIGDLDAEEQYEVEVFQPNERRSEKPATHKFKMRPGIRDITIKVTNDNALLLSWKKPTEIDRNLIGYFATARDIAYKANCTYVAVVTCPGCNYTYTSPYFQNATSVGNGCRRSELRIMRSDSQPDREKYYALIQGLSKTSRYEIRVGMVDENGGVDLTPRKEQDMANSGSNEQDEGIPLAVHLYYLPVWVLVFLLIVINISHAIWTRRMKKEQYTDVVITEEVDFHGRDPYYEDTGTQPQYHQKQKKCSIQ